MYRSPAGSLSNSRLYTTQMWEWGGEVTLHFTLTLSWLPAEWRNFYYSQDGVNE